MLFLVGAALALQVSININGNSRGRTVVRDSTSDTTVAQRAPKRLAVTAQLLATAFDATSTRALYDKARRARLVNDSSLHNYDAKTLQRMSVGMGLGKLGRDHLLYRQESATHVQWQRGIGAWISVTGARVAIPMAPSDAETDDLQGSVGGSDMSPIPYFPGMEALWIGGASARAEVDDRDIVNPLGEGAEAYYKFEIGDSLSWKLGDNTTINLAEIKFRPRTPKWNLAVGSMLFDASSGQLVEATYRLSVPMDIIVAAEEDDPKSTEGLGIAKAFLSPLNMQVTSIVVEYGLYEGNYWLPKLRAFEGNANVLFMHVPVKIEQSFSYARVNGPDTLPKIVIAQTAGRGRGAGPNGRGGPPPDPNMPNPARVLDSASARSARRWRDSVAAARGEAPQSVRDSAAAVAAKRAQAAPNGRGANAPGVNQSQCDTSAVRVITQYRYSARLPVAIVVPCDVQKLTHSPDLPPSIYDPGEDLFGAKEVNDLVSKALTMSAQPQFSLLTLPHPAFQYGVAMTRYNRVEGFSTGLGISEQLGGGYTASALGRFGFADHEPNVELSGARSNLSKTLQVTAYNHLVSAGDWGNPLSFGSSLRAFLFGRDEGFYYRATGAELTSTNDVGTQLQWRLFAEQERSAAQKTNFSLGADFPANLVAARGTFAGGSLAWADTRGLDPNGFQLVTNLRLEAAGGDSAYGRGAVDLRLSHNLGSLAAASVAVSGGNSIGELPAQRRWYLGGTQTVRGQSPDTAQSGNAFWLARGELGRGPSAARVTVFTDLGWAGDRTKLSQVGRPLSGVGAGLSMLDGLFRFDVARGLYPRQQWRVDLYLEGRY